VSRSPIAITVSFLALIVPAFSPVSALSDGVVVGTITKFTVPEIDVYDSAGEFLCAVDPRVLTGSGAGDPCAGAGAEGSSGPRAAGSEAEAAPVLIRQITEDGQFLVELGGKSFRLDPFQVDAQMNETSEVKSRCPKLAGRAEMAATRGLGESGCVTEKP
jgi:hypothetical protein